MSKRVLFILSLLVTLSTSSYATTWNEPWADSVIKQAASFVLAKIESIDAAGGIKIQIIKTLGGVILKDSLLISNFYSLEICSTTGGHGPEFYLEDGADSCYFFIKKNSKGEYCIATPTAGIDYITNGKVAAVFRHSYNGALIPIEVYEKMMTAVFNNYHGKSYDKDYVNSYVNACISKKPAGFSKDEINTFFEQHVALECVYHLKLKVDQNKIFLFLNDTSNFHNQVSAARALVACNTAESRMELCKIVCDTSRSHFVQVVCIWTLSELGVKEEKKALNECLKFASEEEVSFGGRLMDPRICTYMPTVKDALKKLLQKK